MTVARSFHFTSESVTEGHPDKMADQVSDTILDALLAEDPQARVACETFLTTGLALVGGEITTTAYVDIPRLVREKIASIGYTRSEYGFDAQTCSVIVAVDPQSPDIAQGVDEAYEAQHEPGRRGSARPPGRGRPGDDVRLRVPRDGRADAVADHARAQDLQAARRGSQGRRAPLPPAGRQGAGDRSVRGRRARPPDAGRDRARSHLDAALRRGGRRVAHQAGPHRARALPDPAARTCTTRPVSSTRTSST